MISGGEIDEDIKLNIDEGVLAEVFTLSNAHDIANIVGEAVFKNELIEESAKTAQDFKRAMLSSVVRYQRLRFELKRVCNLFENNKICHIPLKGAVVRKLYPDPWMRTSGDIDILVKKEDLTHAADILQNDAGCTYHKMSEHDVAFYAPSGVHVELHYDFLEDAFSPEEAWSAAVSVEGSEYKKSLSPEMLVLHHIAHMAKHMKNGGCGLRPFVDLWFIKKNLEYDEAAFRVMLCEKNLKKFADTAFDLAESMFCGTPEKLSAEVLKYVLDAGVYGSMENRVAVGQINKKGKIRYAMSRIFLKRSTLKYAYPVLEKHGWLTPFCQVHRWVMLIKNGKVKTAFDEFAVSHSMDEEKISSVSMLLKELELM